MAWGLWRAWNEFDHAGGIAGGQAAIDGPAEIALETDQMAVDCRWLQADDGLEVGAVRREGWRADCSRREWVQVVLSFAPRALAPRGELAEVAGVIAATGE